MSLAASIKRRILDARASMLIERMFSKSVFMRHARSKKITHGRGTRHVLIAATGGGSVGDQAMLETFISQVRGDITVIVRHESDILRVPAAEASRITVVALPELLYGGTRPHLSAMRQFAQIAVESNSVSVVGADIMDGAYNMRASVRRFWLAEFAGSLGISARVLGFSWNTAPAPQAADAMRRASRVALLMARDPESAARLRGGGARLVRDVADLAFLMPTLAGTAREVTEWMAAEQSTGRTVVLVNANYLLEGHISQVAIYRKLIDDLTQRGFSFVLLPHDSRKSPSDETLVADIWSSLRQRDHTKLVPRIAMPDEVGNIAASADLAVTGRMHLAILCANVFTPAVAVSYQGKIEGLYRRLNLTCYIEPDSVFEESLRREIETVTQFLSETRRALEENLPNMQSLARLNLDGIPQP